MFRPDLVPLSVSGPVECPRLLHPFAYLLNADLARIFTARWQRVLTVVLGARPLRFDEFGEAGDGGDEIA